MLAPTTFEMTDYLVVESTYGDRTHPTVDPMIELREIISKTVDRGGVVLIPAFAVGRVQLLLYYLWRLRTSKAIPNIPIYLNSPMATDTNTIFLRHHNEHRLSEVEAQAVCNIARCITSAHESMDLNSRREPMVIIAASGMATGGRILHHLKAFGGDSKNTILFVGHQAEGTRGRNIVDGQKQVKIHGQYWPIRAEVRQIHTLSAHADSEEVLSWLSLFKRPPRLTFLTHGEPQASLSLMKAIDERLRWTCAIPKYDQEFSLN
jgi:metallo-beta-lactamase family protein